MDVAGLTSDEAYDLAVDRATPPEILALLLRSVHGNARMAAAWNPSTPVHALLDALEWGDVRLRTIIVGNKSLPLVEAIRIVFTDKEEVLQMFSYRKDLPPEVMIKLASHENVVIVTGLVRNPNMPVEAGLLATRGRSEGDLRTIFGHQTFPFTRIAAWLETKGVDLSTLESPNSFPFQFFVDWLNECEDSWTHHYSLEYVITRQIAGVRAYMEAVTGAMGLPDAWVVKTFKTLVRKF